jgi:hypothetical protein
MTHRPRIRWLPGDTVWYCEHRRRSAKRECPRCEGRGWKVSDRGNRYSFGTCTNGEVTEGLPGYEVPIEGLVESVTLYMSEAGERQVEYRVSTPWQAGRVQHRGGGDYFFDTEEEAWASIRERGYALEQVEGRG